VTTNLPASAGSYSVFYCIALAARAAFWVACAYFNRAADGAGFAFWEAQTVAAEIAGQSTTVALNNVANSFAPQPETEALYPSLDPYLGPNPPPLNTAAGHAALITFVDSVYINLFNRPTDTPGENYWVDQLANGLVGLGAAALVIANGATGTDATRC
jgi:uncharacterized protein DUF4214